MLGLDLALEVLYVHACGLALFIIMQCAGAAVLWPVGRVTVAPHRLRDARLCFISHSIMTPHTTLVGESHTQLLDGFPT